MRFATQPRDLDQLQKELQALFANVQDMDSNELKLTLKRMIPEYRPYLAEPAVPTPMAAVR
jgi:hypothetical protein